MRLKKHCTFFKKYAKQNTEISIIFYDKGNNHVPYNNKI